MKKLCSISIVLIGLLAATAPAQETKSATKPPEHSVVLDVSVIGVNESLKEDFGKLTQDKSRLERLITDGKLRQIASLQLRARTGGDTSIRSNQRVPVPTSSPTANGSLMQYDNTGLNLVVHPTLLDNERVILILTLELSEMVREPNSLGPITAQRTLFETLQIRNGETVLLAGLMQYESLWPVFSQSGAPITTRPRGSYFVLLTARLGD
jgi:Flp pilus assembly secretin CpaC